MTVAEALKRFRVECGSMLGLRDTPKPLEVGADEVQEAREFRKALEKFVEQTKGGD